MNMQVQRKIKGVEVKDGDLVLLTYKEKLRKGTRVGFITFNGIGVNRLLGHEFMLFDEIKWNKLDHKGFTFGFHSDRVENIEVLGKNIKDIVGENLWKKYWKTEQEGS